MDRDAILQRVIEALGDYVDSTDDLGEASSFKVLDIDSFDMLELITDLEDAFDLEFPDEDLGSIATIGDAVDAIEAAL